MDGNNILNINCDDAAGFRLDIITTCKQYATPVVQGCEVLTTILQYFKQLPTTFPQQRWSCEGSTSTLQEPCQALFRSCNVREGRYLATTLWTSHPKQIDCIRVDGAGGEGPGHESVQYWWTYWHITQSKAATLVTTRCSGSSYLNRVELQNGSLSLGHANTFIPSTLSGSCLDPETGAIDENKTKKNPLHGNFSIHFTG